ncbi:epoxide hydrolase [Skermania sp. ID1734]|uniref:limonene-1,2-epoxide hydrolase family protein n=1 Tax=Skermania sp. ID1734 TaxID=2597516 RepID=UPI0011815E68|nr:limonene-1,2-epoxide hydrolase family protein [Skermania sp. ID1734]TSE01985.1 epoxide hydrolase [Skermania sp. ID1734]
MTSSSDLEQAAATTVREFLHALEMGELDEALELLTDDALWRNTSLPTIRGRKRIGRLLAPLSRPPFGFAVEFHHVAAHGNVVLTDRTDVITVGPVRIAFWVCGTFELADGRIAIWHDHFSWANFLRGTAIGAVQAMLPGRPRYATAT